MLHVNSQLSDTKIKKAIPFAIATKIKYLGMNLTKSWNMCTKYYKTLMKENEEDTKGWKIFCVHGLKEYC